jgi:hypothetical protein
MEYRSTGVMEYCAKSELHPACAGLTGLCANAGPSRRMLSDFVPEGLNDRSQAL